jgi:hypothetical protein
MTSQSFAGLAGIVALTFLVMALHGCASPAQVSANAHVSQPTATPEFHDAHIGGDALRERLTSEN